MSNLSRMHTDLLDRARRLTGIRGKTALLNAALSTLIAQIAAERLADMGGIDPTFKAPPRRRLRALSSRPGARKGRR